jgi:hypothetical protein
LGVELLDGHPLDVIVLRDDDHAVLLGDEVLVGDLARILDDGRLAVVVVLVFDVAEFVLDDVQ